MEETRHRLGLSAYERDRLLQRAGLRPSHFNPALYINYHDERLILGPRLAPVCDGTHNAWLTQVRRGPPAAAMLPTMGPTAAAGMMSPMCSTADCGSNSLPAAGRGLQQCRHCFRTYCRGCMNTGDMRILEYRWLSPQSVCLKCFGRLSRIESSLHELAALRRTRRAGRRWPGAMAVEIAAN